MSYGSTFLQFEANGRISNRFSRPSYKKDDSPAKLVHYEKQFDVNLSRVDDDVKIKPNVRDSMVAYTRKMRTIQDSRYSQQDSRKEDPLFVRAKHIPKYPSRQPKKRRPLSFDELLGRDRDTNRDRPGAARNRPQSDKVKPAHALHLERKSENNLHLPLITNQIRKTGNVHVSLVSASDLYDIVDFSLRSKATRNESLQMLRLESEINEAYESPRSSTGSNGDPFEHNTNKRDVYGAFERKINRSSDKSIGELKLNDSENAPRDMFSEHEGSATFANTELYSELISLDKGDVSLKKQPSVNIFSPPRLSQNTDYFKRRPHRAKRMKLVDSGLGDIPEDNVLEARNNAAETKREKARINSPTPQKLSPRLTESPIKTSLDAIQENYIRDSTKYVNGAETIFEESVSSIKVDITPLKMQEKDETVTRDMKRYTGTLPLIEDVKNSTKKVLKDDGDVRIEVTQCPPKNEIASNKIKAQKRFKKLIYLRDGTR